MERTGGVMKKEYSSPEFHFLTVELSGALLSSPENFNSYVDPNPGDWNNPIIDPDDDIQW